MVEELGLGDDKSFPAILAGIGRNAMIDLNHLLQAAANPLNVCVSMVILVLGAYLADCFFCRTPRH